MPNRLKNRTLVPPPGMFIYINPEDGWRIESHAFNVLESKAKEYRRINNYPIGSQWSEDFEDNVCKNHPEGTCFKYEPLTLEQKAKSATLALFNWAKRGFKVRTEEEINQIKAICETCSYYNGQRGLFKVACGKCGCSSKKYYLKSEHCPLSPPRWT